MLRSPFNLRKQAPLWGEGRARKHKKLSRSVEKAIYSKFKGRCAICGRKIEFSDGEVDHIKPLAKGGTDSPSNLQWLCHRCNKLKGSKRTNAQVRELLGLKRIQKIRRAKKKTIKRKPKKKQEDGAFGVPDFKVPDFKVPELDFGI